MKKTDSSNLSSKEENTELITREQIDETPFTVIGTKEGFFGSIGKYRITEPVETAEEVKKELEVISWNRITQIMLILIETQK